LTIVSNLKSCIASMKGAKESLSRLVLLSSADQAKRAFHESMMEMEEIEQDLTKRLAVIERKKPQYKS